MRPEALKEKGITCEKIEIQLDVTFCMLACIRGEFL